MTAALRFDPVDFDRFHAEELPRRIAAGHGALAAPDLPGVAPLAFRLPGGAAWTYAPGRRNASGATPGRSGAANAPWPAAIRRGSSSAWKLSLIHI